MIRPQGSAYDLGASEYALLTSVAEGDDKSTWPSEFHLEQNYPNPFNPETSIRYSLPRPSHVRIEVYNALGELVRILVDEKKTAGNHSVNWDGTDYQGRLVASGVYFYQMTTGTEVHARKMLFLQ